MNRTRLFPLTALLALGLSACAPAATQATATSTEATSTANRALVLRLVKDGLAPANAGVVQTLVAENYIEHDPQIATGRAGLLSSLAERGPQKYDVIRTLSDGDLVIVHARAGQKAALPPAARFDVFRVAGGQITEHWAAQQADADKPGASGHTLLDGETAITDLNRTVQNKLFVHNFYTELFRKGNVAALSAIDPKQYLQHNPAIPDGLETVTAFFKAALASAPAAPAPATPVAPPLSSPLLVSGEGNFVLVRSVAQFGPQPSLVYDLFRLRNNLIVEHWDIIETITGTPKNSNGPL